MSTITTFLTFNDQTEAAMTLYTSIFKKSRVVSTSRYGDTGPAPKGQLMVAEVELDGQPFMLLNGGPTFTFSQGISLLVKCETQAEIDDLSAKLTADGGEQGPCGWLTDRFGVSWQVIPAILGSLMADKDPVKAGRVMQAMMQMKKLDLAALQRAHAGSAS